MNEGVKNMNQLELGEEGRDNNNKVLIDFECNSKKEEIEDEKVVNKPSKTVLIQQTGNKIRYKMPRYIFVQYINSWICFLYSLICLVTLIFFSDVRNSSSTRNYLLIRLGLLLIISIFAFVTERYQSNEHQQNYLPNTVTTKDQKANTLMEENLHHLRLSNATKISNSIWKEWLLRDILVGFAVFVVTEETSSQQNRIEAHIIYLISFSSRLYQVHLISRKLILVIATIVDLFVAHIYMFLREDNQDFIIMIFTSLSVLAVVVTKEIISGDLEVKSIEKIKDQDKLVSANFTFNLLAPQYEDKKAGDPAHIFRHTELGEAHPLLINSHQKPTSLRAVRTSNPSLQDPRNPKSMAISVEKKIQPRFSIEAQQKGAEYHHYGQQSGNTPPHSQTFGQIQSSCSQQNQWSGVFHNINMTNSVNSGFHCFSTQQIVSSKMKNQESLQQKDVSPILEEDNECLGMTRKENSSPGQICTKFPETRQNELSRSNLSLQIQKKTPSQEDFFGQKQKEEKKYKTNQKYKRSYSDRPKLNNPQDNNLKQNDILMDFNSKENSVEDISITLKIEQNSNNENILSENSNLLPKQQEDKAGRKVNVENSISDKKDSLQQINNNNGHPLYSDLNLQQGQIICSSQGGPEINISSVEKQMNREASSVPFNQEENNRTLKKNMSIFHNKIRNGAVQNVSSIQKECLGDSQQQCLENKQRFENSISKDFFNFFPEGVGFVDSSLKLLYANGSLQNFFNIEGNNSNPTSSKDDIAEMIYSLRNDVKVSELSKQRSHNAVNFLLKSIVRTDQNIKSSDQNHNFKTKSYSNIRQNDIPSQSRKFSILPKQNIFYNQQPNQILSNKQENINNGSQSKPSVSQGANDEKQFNQFASFLLLQNQSLGKSIPSLYNLGNLPSPLLNSANVFSPLHDVGNTPSPLHQSANIPSPLSGNLSSPSIRKHQNIIPTVKEKSKGAQVHISPTLQNTYDHTKLPEINTKGPYVSEESVFETHYPVNDASNHTRIKKKQAISKDLKTEMQIIIGQVHLYLRSHSVQVDCILDKAFTFTSRIKTSSTFQINSTSYASAKSIKEGINQTKLAQVAQKQQELYQSHLHNKTNKKIHSSINLNAKFVLLESQSQMNSQRDANRISPKLQISPKMSSLQLISSIQDQPKTQMHSFPKQIIINDDHPDIPSLINTEHSTISAPRTQVPKSNNVADRHSLKKQIVDFNEVVISCSSENEGIKSQEKQVNQTSNEDKQSQVEAASISPSTNTVSHVFCQLSKQINKGIQNNVSATQPKSCLIKRASNSNGENANFHSNNMIIQKSETLHICDVLRSVHDSQFSLDVRPTRDSPVFNLNQDLKEKSCSCELDESSYSSDDSFKEDIPNRKNTVSLQISPLQQQPEKEQQQHEKEKDSSRQVDFPSCQKKNNSGQINVQKSEKEDVELSEEGTKLGKRPREVDITLFVYIIQGNPVILMLVRDVTHRSYIKLLQDVSKKKSKMVSFVSHELRTPLNSIIAMLETMKMDPQSDYIETALMNSKYLLCISNDLLDLAQIQVNKFHIRKKPFNLKQLVMETMQMFQIQAERQQIELIVNYQQHLPTYITSDKNRIRQVLINLIGNAFKFTLNGSITLQVSKLDNNLLQINISDTGIGIKESDLNKLFKTFGKLDGEESVKLNEQGILVI